MAKEMTAQYGDYVITIEESGAVKVSLNGSEYKNTKAALRDIAEEINFQFDTNWNTQHFGKKLAEHISTHDFSLNNSLSTRTEIVLNKMFVGYYLTQGNIGHEIINFYADDNGDKYIYLNKDGKLRQESVGKVKYVLNVRTIPGENKLQVISISEIKCDIKTDKVSQDKLAQNITYSGVSLKEIFSENASQQDTFITFKAKRNIDLGNNSNFVIDCNNDKKETEDKKIIPAFHDRHYIDNTKPYYGQIMSLINEYIKAAPEVATSQESPIKQIFDENYFEICGIEYDELAFSNAFVYFAKKYRHHIIDFFKKYGKKYGINLSESLRFSREEKHVDILIRDYENKIVIVIENKIKSDINGKQKTQSGPIKSQLTDYYNYATQKVFFDGKEPNEVKCFIFSPDYNDFDEENLKQYQGGNNNYTPIKYSDLYNHYIDQIEYTSDWRFQDFVNALHRHTAQIDDFETQMKNQFFSRIHKVKNSPKTK